MKCEVCNKECTGVTCANWDNEEIKMVCDECLNMNNENWEEEYKSLYNLFCHERSISKKLKLEIRSLHRKLHDANRGAERLHLMNAQLRIELVAYKIKHPEKLS